MKIYVGNLPYTVTDEELRQVLEQFGAVTSATIIMDREKGRSKGFGFVEMADGDGKKAIEALNGTELKGRTVVVNEAQPRPEGGGNRGGNRGRRPGGRGPSGNRGGREGGNR
jgi:cold-inducible RNA-binding protein